MCLAALLSFLGCKKAPTYPFDIEKAYHTTRPGIIAGGRIFYTFSEEGAMTYYEYPEYPPKYEGGMRDRGAQVYFVGLRPGTVTVTMNEISPVGDRDSDSFDLIVDDDLRVTRA